MGLGLSVAVFDADEDAAHVHSITMEKFTALETCGGYTLLCLTENSHSTMEIERHEGGMTVHYQKDVLNQAKLYI